MSCARPVARLAPLQASPGRPVTAIQAMYPHQTALVGKQRFGYKIPHFISYEMAGRRNVLLDVGIERYYNSGENKNVMADTRHCQHAGYILEV